jgi:signal transduction histidine kinase
VKNKLIFISMAFSLAIALVVGLLFVENRQNDANEMTFNQIVAVNELEQLAMQGELEQLSKKSAVLQDSLRFTQRGTASEVYYLILGTVCILYGVFVFGYVYVSILKPFDKMKIFAREIAQGNFDMPLHYERSNYFGEFTWAFDSMRREIVKSRASEKEAIENNKTVIATLSHDIKTPIASIRVYAEGLEANMDNSVEKRQKYLSVIMKKCDEVSNLTNDLFLHALSDLDKLEITTESFEICDFLRTVIGEISAEREDIRLKAPDEMIMVCADKKRLMQVCENLINNARKYARTYMDVSVEQRGKSVEIVFRDYGGGIPDQDMPFIYEKFYRGKNCGMEQGSGLGLYIVKYVLKKMRGEVYLYNKSDGLEVVVTLPVNF